MDIPIETRGRPVKEADINFPRRKSTQELIKQLTEGKDNARENQKHSILSSFDERPIGIFGTSAEAEQKPPQPTVEQRESTEEIDELHHEPNDSYYCLQCDFPLLGGEGKCPGCQEKLDWSGIR